MCKQQGQRSDSRCEDALLGYVNVTSVTAGNFISVPSRRDDVMRLLISVVTASFLLLQRVTFTCPLPSHGVGVTLWNYGMEYLTSNMLINSQENDSRRVMWSPCFLHWLVNSFLSLTWGWVELLTVVPVYMLHRYCRWLLAMFVQVLSFRDHH